MAFAYPPSSNWSLVWSWGNSAMRKWTRHHTSQWGDSGWYLSNNMLTDDRWQKGTRLQLQRETNFIEKWWMITFFSIDFWSCGKIVEQMTLWIRSACCLTSASLLGFTSATSSCNNSASISSSASLSSSVSFSTCAKFSSDFSAFVFNPSFVTSAIGSLVSTAFPLNG